MSTAAVPQARGGLPLVGHLFQIIRDPIGYVDSLRAVGPVVRVRLGTMTAYVLTTAATVRQALVEQGRHFQKGKLFDEVRPLLGDGLITSDRELHLRQRRIVQQVFHADRIPRYAVTMREQARQHIGSWRPGQHLQVEREAVYLALATLTHTIFSAPFDATTSADVIRLLRALELGVFVRAISSARLRALTGIDAHFGRASRRLRAIVEQSVLRHEPSEDDLLATLLAARDPATGQPMDLTLVHDELVSFLSAGTETTGNTLAWILHELGQRPDLDERLYAEVSEHADTGGWPDPARLPFARAVVDETLRHYALPLLMRRATAPVRLADTELPAGAEVLVSISALHRDPAVFANPLRFDPDRWLTSGPATRTGYMPFGGGARRCIGDEFARVELVIALATITSRWRLTPVPGHTVRKITRGTTYPNALPMIAEPR